MRAHEENFLGPKSIDPNEKTLRKDFIYKYFSVNQVTRKACDEI